MLRYVEERSYDEIADIMNVPVGTFGTYLHRARAQLKRMLQPAALAVVYADAAGAESHHWRFWLVTAVYLLCLGAIAAVPRTK